MNRSYLDHNATSLVRPEVVDAMMAVWGKPVNPSSVHYFGRQAKQKLEQCRERMAAAVSCFPNEVIFTASGSEANNMALRGFSDRPLLVGATEHSSVLNTAQRTGGDLLPVDRNGLIDLDILQSKLKSLGKPALLSIMLVNNETGVIQPIAAISRIAHEYGALLHCDAVQAFGKIPIDMGLLGADMLTVCAHKMGGPIGVGALILRQNIAIKSLLYGGNQELGRRAGTENIPLITGMVEAIQLAAGDAWLEEIKSAMLAMEARLKKAIPGLQIAGDEVERLGNVSCMMTPGMSSETQLMHLDLAGFCLSAGSACSSGRISPSHVLKAMGYSDGVAGCAIRVSAGWYTRPADLLAFESNWLELAERLAKKAA